MSYSIAHSSGRLRKTGGSTLLATVLGLIAVAHQRRQLTRLDAHLLADIGVSRQQAEAEAARPLWHL